MPNLAGKEGLKKNKDEIDNEFSENDNFGNEGQEAGNESGDANEGEGGSGESGQSNTQNQGQSDSENDANFDAKYVNYLKDTYGFQDNEITEKAVKLAKSDIEKQSYGSKLRSELDKYKQTVQGVESIFEKNPDLYQEFESARTGKRSSGNQQQKESGDDKPSNNVDKLGETNVTEQQLVQEGYLNSDQLDGMSDYERKLEVKSAMIDRKADVRQKQFEQSLDEIETKRQEKRERNSRIQTNKKRLDEGFNDLIAKYKVDFSSDEFSDAYDRIQKRALTIADPDSRGLIDKRAVELSAQLELGDKLKKRESQSTNNTSNNSGKRDTGFNVNKSGSQSSGNKPTSIWDKVDEKTSSGGRYADRKRAFKQRNEG